MNTLPPNPPHSPDGDDELRPDARLRSALQHAPDGTTRPPPALRSAVLQAARASLPPRPTLWQRLFGISPGHIGSPRLWTAMAGVGAMGLALNLAWHMSTVPTPTEYDKVAAVSEAKRAAPPPMAEMREEAVQGVPKQAQPPAPTPSLQKSAAPESPMAQARARRDAAPAPAPVVATTAPAPLPAPAAPPVPAPVVAAAPAQEAEAKLLAKEDKAKTERFADASASGAPAEVIAQANTQGRVSADARARGLAPAAIAPTGVAAGPAADGVRSEPAPIAAAAAKPAAPTASWPAPLARFEAALAAAEDWPTGWQMQGPAEYAPPRRAWWQAMLAGTAGRWEAMNGPQPPAAAAGATWLMHAPDHTGFGITLADGQVWLQADGRFWRAPWAVLPSRIPR